MEFLTVMMTFQLHGKNFKVIDVISIKMDLWKNVKWNNVSSYGKLKPENKIQNVKDIQLQLVNYLIVNVMIVKYVAVENLRIKLTTLFLNSITIKMDKSILEMKSTMKPYKNSLKDVMKMMTESSLIVNFSNVPKELKTNGENLNVINIFQWTVKFHMTLKFVNVQRKVLKEKIVETLLEWLKKP